MPIKIEKQPYARGFWIKLAIITLLLAGLIWLVLDLNKTQSVPNGGTDSDYGYYMARVLAIPFDDATPDFDRYEGRRSGRQEVEAVFTSGPHKGETVKIDNYLTPYAGVDVKVGMKVVVRYQDFGDGNVNLMVYNYNRAGMVAVLAILLAVFLLAVGGKKGFMAILGLLFTLLCLWFILIPLVMRGYNMLLTTILIVSVSTAASLLILDGFSRKAYTAILGCVMGVSVAGLFTWLAGQFAPLNGYHMMDVDRLIYYATTDGMKVGGLLVCGVLIASLGAVMDVAMSISSSVHELRRLNPDLSSRRLFVSGMNIGKDAMGTMANTLILALVGSSLNTFILSHAYEIPFSQLFNTDFIVVELVKGIAGTIGIVLTVPFVAFVSAVARSSVAATAPVFVDSVVDSVE